MFRNQSVDVHQFAMVPRAEIPRSSFRMQKAYKTTFSASYLIPFFVEEMLPGDTFNCGCTFFARMATPIFPVMDNLHLESFFFFVPNRLVWTNWVKFMGEQEDPADSISFTIPQVLTDPADNGWAVGSVGDYMGIPTVGQTTAGNAVSTSALPFRAYNLIYNTWFRDQNLINSAPMHLDDGPDDQDDYPMRVRAKRHDYFTSALPFLQKGTSVTLPLGTSAPVIGNPADNVHRIMDAGAVARLVGSVAGTAQMSYTLTPAATGPVSWPTSAAVGAGTGLITDLSAATSATINQLRQSFQIQKLLERDARGGTRYTEIVRSHFGVLSPDARLQRPEYVGGGHTNISINPVQQTSATSVTGSTTPIGTLSAFGTAVGKHGFTYSATEHGYVIGIINVRADQTYQQGLRRHWTRATRYDYYFPVFAMLGEQAIYNREIYYKAAASDGDVFGYQERWAEYRYIPSEITGLFRSTAAGTLDPWHFSQKFTSLPLLNEAFITDQSAATITRNLAVSTANAQFLLDAFLDIRAARPLPLYSVPGLIDHF